MNLSVYKAIDIGKSKLKTNVFLISEGELCLQAWCRFRFHKFTQNIFHFAPTMLMKILHILFFIEKGEFLKPACVCVCFCIL